MSGKKELGKRFNMGKIRYDLISPIALRKLAMVYTRGAHKYTVYKNDKGELINGKDIAFEESVGLTVVEDGANNWKKGQLWTGSIASIMRHLEDFRLGHDIDTDPSMGTENLANAAWGIFALLEYAVTHPDLDNREKRRVPKIGLDIDNVLADYSNHFFAYNNLPKHLPRHWNDPRFRNDAINEKIRNDKNFYLSMPLLTHPDELAFEPVCYVTARSVPSEWTQQWLDQNRFPSAKLVSVGLGQSKVEALREFDIDYFIDDHYENFVELNQAGIPTYLFTQSHNLKYNVGNKRIDHVNDILNVRNNF